LANEKLFKKKKVTLEASFDWISLREKKIKTFDQSLIN
jgi:hypothetical protein